MPEGLTQLAGAGGALGVFAWLTIRYMRQVLNTQSAHIANQSEQIAELAAAHRSCLDDNRKSERRTRAAERYIDTLRGALIVQGLTVPERPLED